MAPGDAADQVAWAWVDQFHADKMGYHDRMTLLCSQGAVELVMWDPLEHLVLAVDFNGRVTHSIGPLSDRMYYSDLIPYVNSYADIYRCWHTLLLHREVWDKEVKKYMHMLAYVVVINLM